MASNCKSCGGNVKINNTTDMTSLDYYQTTEYGPLPNYEKELQNEMNYHMQPNKPVNTFRTPLGYWDERYSVFTGNPNNHLPFDQSQYNSGLSFPISDKSLMNACGFGYTCQENCAPMLFCPERTCPKGFVHIGNNQCSSIDNMYHTVPAMMPGHAEHAKKQ